MSSSVFLDTDIILDVFAKRVPFYGYAARLLTLIEQHHMTGYTSALIFSNLYYILRKLDSRSTAITHLQRLHALVEILAVEEQSIEFALHSPFTDFEDAIQYHVALQHRIPYVITRNIKDYKAADTQKLTVCTAEDYLTLWDASTRQSARPNGH